MHQYFFSICKILIHFSIFFGGGVGDCPTHFRFSTESWIQYILHIRTRIFTVGFWMMHPLILRTMAHRAAKTAPFPSRVPLQLGKRQTRSPHPRPTPRRGAPKASPLRRPGLTCERWFGCFSFNQQKDESDAESPGK